MKNRDIFGKSRTLITNEKIPNAVYLDYLAGLTPNVQMLSEHIDESVITGSKLLYFRRQFKRDVLDETEVDLIIMDPYSEMNFPIWRHREEGWGFWTPYNAIRNVDAFNEIFVSLGLMSLEAAILDAGRFIEHMRLRNPNAPVLFLPQPVDYYPKLAERSEFNRIGDALAAKFPNIYAGKRLDYVDLEPEDLGTGGGPDFTLHFSGKTYRKMFEHLLDGELGHFLEAKRGPPRISLANTPDPRPAKEVKFNFMSHSENCVPECRKLGKRVRHRLQEYFEYRDAKKFERAKPVRYRCAVIDLDTFSTYEDYEALVKKSSNGNRIRLVKSAANKGYFAEPFSWKLHLPDIYSINTSTDVRSGGVLRDSAKRTVEEMGGYPQTMIPLSTPKCTNHWSIPWGVFIAEDGYRQGDVTVDKQLLGYISLKRYGDAALYSLIMGHYDYLKDGVMIFLHHMVMRWLLRREDVNAQGIRYVMYGGMDQGTEGLVKWKSREGFFPANVTMSFGRRLTEPA